MRYRLLVGAIDRDTYRAAAGTLLEALRAESRFDRLVGAINRSRLLIEP